MPAKVDFVTGRGIVAKLKETVKNMPIMGDIYRELYDRYYLIRMKFRSAEKVFTDIYDTNAWGGGIPYRGKVPICSKLRKSALSCQDSLKPTM